VLVGQGEELPRAGRPSLTQRLEQSLDHSPEQLVGLEVQWRMGQTRLAHVEERNTKLMQPSDRPAQQGPHHRLGRGIVGLAGPFVQVAADGGGRLFLFHDNSSRSAAESKATNPAAT